MNSNESRGSPACRVMASTARWEVSVSQVGEVLAEYLDN